MKNILMYYYNMNVSNIRQKGEVYFFENEKNSYIFTMVDRNIEEINQIFSLSKILMENKIYCHEIIINNNDDILTTVNNKKYILMKNSICSNDIISINEIINFSIRTRNIWNYDNLNRFDWKKLWIDKLQNLEYQISQFHQNSNLLVSCFNYYGGLVENNIQFLNEIYDDNNISLMSVAHKRLEYTMTLNEFYNPLNYIIDYSSRDIAEYLKSKLINKIDVIDEYLYCIKSSYYTQYEKKMMVARILYPSYQLDIFEKCFFENNKKYRERITDLLVNNEIYEKSIKKIYVISTTYISNIPYVEWLTLD